MESEQRVPQDNVAQYRQVLEALQKRVSELRAGEMPEDGTRWLQDQIAVLRNVADRIEAVKRGASSGADAPG